MNSHLDSIADWASLARHARYRSGDLALLCQVSPRQLERYFRGKFGRSPQKWLDALRLHEAASGVRSGKQVKEVALDLGFIHPSHFIQKFKRMYGCTPLKFSVGVAQPQYDSRSLNPARARV